MTGNVNITGVSFDTVTIPSTVSKIDGDLSISLTSAVTSFSAPGLETITGTFELLNLTALSSVSAPSLASVGAIYFVILPVFQTMTLGITEIGNVRISDTQLTSLNGLSLSTVNDFGIGIVLVLTYPNYR